MTDKQTINELHKTHADDTNEIARLLIENAQLREAVKAEREACAKIAANYNYSPLKQRDGRIIAEKIRARNT